MLTDIRRGNQDFGQRDGVVWQEVELEIIFRVRIGIDDAGNVDDKANGQLGNIIYGKIDDQKPDKTT